MATLCIEVPNPIAVRVVNAIATLHGYPEFVDIGIGVDPEGNHIPEIVPNPESKQEFVRKYITTHLKNQVVVYEADLAAKLAKENAEAGAINDIVIT